MLRLLLNARCLFSSAKRVGTQVYQGLTNSQIANPSLAKKLMTDRILNHSKVTLVSLYHGKRTSHAIKSCFSEKKTKRFKRVHIIKKYFHSQVLNTNLKVRISNKAYRCIKKCGSFDNYILTTKPEDLDSKLGQYLRSLMLRKINDPQYRIPYVLGTNKVPRLKKFFRYMSNKEASRIMIPKDFKEKFRTFQRKFGTNVDQLNNEDYRKYLELEKLKKVLGDELRPDHPLLLELDKKLKHQIDPDEEAQLAELSKKYANDYLTEKCKDPEMRKIRYARMVKEGTLINNKLRQAWIKFRSSGDADGEGID